MPVVEGEYFLVATRGVVVLEAIVDLLGVLAPMLARGLEGVELAAAAVAFFPLVLNGLGRVILSSNSFKPARRY